MSLLQTEVQALIEELDIASDRITRYSNSPMDGLLSAAARMLERLAPAPASGKLVDSARIRCRKCGEQSTIEFNSARIVTHNPYTGKPRDQRDIDSDPEGKLMIDPGNPLRAAPADVMDGLDRSVALNRVVWKLADAMGLVPEGADKINVEISDVVNAACRALAAQPERPQSADDQTHER